MMTQSTPTDAIDIAYPDREQWLPARRGQLQASECAGALWGEGYADQSAFSIWCDKTTTEPVIIDPEREERFMVGQEMEPGILSIFTRLTGLQLLGASKFVIRRNAAYPWLGATLDDECEDPERGMCAVEAKCVSSHQAKEWKDGGSPLQAQVQVQVQLVATGYSYGYLIGIVDNKHHLRLMPRDERFINEALLPKSEKFWELVKSKTPPPVDDSKATARALAKLFPEENREAIDLPPEAAEWDAERQRLKAEIKALTAVERGLSNKLREAIGENVIGVLPDGGQYTLTTTNRKEYTVAATSYRTLRRRK